MGLPLGMGLLLHALLGIARVPLEDAETAVNLALLWPTIAVAAKRWHDRDKSAWWLLIVLLPLLGLIWMLVERRACAARAGPTASATNPATATCSRARRASVAAGDAGHAQVHVGRPGHQRALQPAAPAGARAARR